MKIICVWIDGDLPLENDYVFERYDEMPSDDDATQYVGQQFIGCYDVDTEAEARTLADADLRAGHYEKGYS